jgi:hypothetical protein
VTLSKAAFVDISGEGGVAQVAIDVNTPAAGALAVPIAVVPPHAICMGTIVHSSPSL